MAKQPTYCEKSGEACSGKCGCGGSGYAETPKGKSELYAEMLSYRKKTVEFNPNSMQEQRP